jgi:hypothetical protein
VRAKRVDETQKAIVSALRGAGAYVWIIGLPVDLVVGVGGRHTVLVECKSLTGKKKPKPKAYTDLQRDFMRDWLGGPVATLTDVPGAIALVNMLKGLPSVPALPVPD